MSLGKYIDQYKYQVLIGMQACAIIYILFMVNKQNLVLANLLELLNSKQTESKKEYKSLGSKNESCKLQQQKKLVIPIIQKEETPVNKITEISFEEIHDEDVYECQPNEEDVAKELENELKELS